MQLEAIGFNRWKKIDEYYKSQKKIFDYLVDWKEPPTLRRRASKVVMVLVVASAVSLLLTLIPMLPFILSIGLPRVGRELTPVTILGSYLDPSLQYWLLCLIGSLTGLTIFGLLYYWVEPPPSDPEYSLSPNQVSFIFLYTGFAELRLYLIDNLTEHVDKATRAIQKLLRPPPFALGRVRGDVLLRESYVLPEDFPPHLLVPNEIFTPLPRPAMATQLQITSKFLRTYAPYPWFRMDEQTEATLRALTSFPSKIYTRLVAKQDLPKVKTVLEHLTRWVYAYLPELEASRTREELQALRQAGDSELAHFTAQMESLTEYELPSPPVPEKRPKRPSMARRILTRESILVRFIFCFVLILILTSALSFVAVQAFGVQRENAILVTISTSVGGAATLAVVPLVIKGEGKT